MDQCESVGDDLPFGYYRQQAHVELGGLAKMPYVALGEFACFVKGLPTVLADLGPPARKKAPYVIRSRPVRNKAAPDAPKTQKPLPKKRVHWRFLDNVVEGALYVRTMFDPTTNTFKACNILKRLPKREQLNGNNGSCTNSDDHAAENSCPCAMIEAVPGQSRFKKHHQVAPLKLRKSIRRCLFKNLRFQPNHLIAWRQHPRIYTMDMFWRDCWCQGLLPVDVIDEYAEATDQVGFPTALRAIWPHWDKHDSTPKHEIRSEILSAVLKKGQIDLPLALTWVEHYSPRAFALDCELLGYNIKNKFGLFVATQPVEVQGVLAGSQWIRDLTRECIEPNPGPGPKKAAKQHHKKAEHKKKKSHQKSKRTRRAPSDPVSTAQDTKYTIALPHTDMIKVVTTGRLVDLNINGVVGQVIYDSVIDILELALAQRGNGTSSTIGDYMKMYTQYHMKHLELQLHMKNIANADFEIGVMALDPRTPIDLNDIATLYELRSRTPNTWRLNRQSLAGKSTQKAYTNMVRLPISIIDSVRYCQSGLAESQSGLVRLIIFVYQVPVYVPIAASGSSAIIPMETTAGLEGVFFFNTEIRFLQKIPPDSVSSGIQAITTTTLTEPTLARQISNQAGTTYAEANMLLTQVPPAIALDVAAAAYDEEGTSEVVLLQTDGSADLAPIVQTVVEGLGIVAGFIFPEAAPIIAGIEAVFSLAADLVSTPAKEENKARELNLANGLPVPNTQPSDDMPQIAVGSALNTNSIVNQSQACANWIDQFNTNAAIVQLFQRIIGGTSSSAKSNPLMIFTPVVEGTSIACTYFESVSALGPELLTLNQSNIAAGIVAGPTSQHGGIPVSIEGRAHGASAPRPYSSSFNSIIRYTLPKYIAVLFDVGDPGTLRLVPLILAGRSGSVFTFNHALNPPSGLVAASQRDALMSSFFGATLAGGRLMDVTASYCYRGRTNSNDISNLAWTLTGTVSMDYTVDHSSGVQLSRHGVVNTVIEFNNYSNWGGIRTSAYYVGERVTRDSNGILRQPVLSNAASGVGTNPSPIYSIVTDF